MATKMMVVFNDLDKLSGKLLQRAGQAAQQAAQMTEQVIKNDMRQAKSGRVYERGKKGKRLHQASAPGESPAVDMGHLFSSIETKRDGVTAAVFTNAEQAEVLELGGRYMEARPFMTPAVDEIRPKYWKMMAEVLK
jgi:HK97 gp10 family phage protein